MGGAETVVMRVLAGAGFFAAFLALEAKKRAVCWAVRELEPEPGPKITAKRVAEAWDGMVLAHGAVRCANSTNWLLSLLEMEAMVVIYRSTDAEVVVPYGAGNGDRQRGLCGFED